MKSVSVTVVVSLFLLSDVASFSMVKPSTSRLALQRPALRVGPVFAEAKNDSIKAVMEREATATSTKYIILEEPMEEVEDLSEGQKLIKKIKEAGAAGVVSYTMWELAFWGLSVPIVILGYAKVTGHFPDLSDKEDLAKLGAEAFAFVNFARFAVPLRIGLALSTTPWIQENVVDRFTSKEEIRHEETNQP